ncbi:MAG: asparagine synthase (glutamine-hydrolyzing) [Anaerolineae bacterium]|nr:asparagine synthase (glutamine-hydrolyzing) [Anaerolineae bacterium]
MCGIAGVVDLTGHKRVEPALVHAMCATIRHRGPDGDGFFEAPNAALGMRRLSIIDVAGSDQPLYNEDRSLALVFNGEIYNYKELRADLLQQGHTLHTDGDGETLLHLYEQYGLDLFWHLRGMYAFALWDSARERLLLAVDHIGIKPLYLYERDGLLYFASEVKAFVGAGILQPSLHLETLDTYMSFGYMIGEQTLFAGVRRLMPGHALVVENGAAQTVEYWRFGTGFETTDHPANTAHARNGSATADSATVIDTARNLLTESVRLHLRSDVPLGLFLSGGIDSAAILALMSQQAETQVNTYTVGYSAETPDNELAQAQRIAAHFGAQHHTRVITANDWWTGLEKYAYTHDEPNANSSAVSLMLLAEETAKHVKVVLTGLGGDELFGGYPHHRTIPQLMAMQARLAALEWVASPLGALEAYYPAFKRYRYVGALPTYLPRLRHALLPSREGIRRTLSFDGMVMSDTLRSSLYGDELRTTWTRVRHKENAFAEILKASEQPNTANTALALVINTWLHGNALLHGDKVTMAHSLEARVPFFDPNLLDFAARVPPELRMRSNKHILREAMRPYLPGYALERPKQPFSTPIRHWFDHDLQPRIAEVLLDRSAYIRSLFNIGALERLLRKHFEGHEKHEEVVFRLLLLELWAKRFLDVNHAERTAVAAITPGRASHSQSPAT